MTLTDAVKEMIISAMESMEVTSANPTHINRLIQVNNISTPDLDKYLTPTTTDTPLLNLKTEKNIISKTVDKPIIPTGFDLSNITKDQVEGMFKKVGLNPKTLIQLGLSGGNIAPILGGLGGAAARVFPPLLVVTMVAALIPEIIKTLTAPGGWLDKRVRIDVTKEVMGILDRQTLQNTNIGDRQVIIQQFAGFRSGDGEISTNTSKMITQNSGRTLGLFDRSYGVT